MKHFQSRTVSHYAVESTALMCDELEHNPMVPNVRRPHRRCSGNWRNAFVTLLTLIAAMGFVLFIGGQCAYKTPLYQIYIQPTVATWWGSHQEMVDPSYLLLVGVGPTLICIAAVQLLQSVRLQRSLWSTAKVLRRRPRANWISYGELLFLLILVGGNMIVFWYTLTQRHHRPPNTLQFTDDEPPHPPPPSVLSVRTVGNALGFNSVLNLALLFLPATRNCAWMELLNISYANGIKYHRWLGVAAVLTGFVHGVCYYYCWLKDGTWAQKVLPCWDCSLRERKGRKIWINVFGEIAVLCFMLIGVTSIPWVRRNMYNLFYYVHQLLFVAVVFTALHWARALWFILPTFVAYLFSRGLSHCNGATPARVVHFSALSPTLCKLVIARSPGKQGDFQVGQFVYLNVPAISRLQWHAFTIASSPRTPTYADPTSKTMVLLIKSLGDWTQKLIAYTQECESSRSEPEAYVDGYYGESLSDVSAAYDTVVLIGGGVGITPLLAILEDVCATAENRQLQGRKSFTQHVDVVFAMRELELLKEMYPLLTRIRDLDPRGRYVSVSLTLTTTPQVMGLEIPLHINSKSCSTATPTQYFDLRPRRFQPFARRDRPFAPSLSANSISLVHFVAFGTVVGLVLVFQFGNGVLVDPLHDSVWVVQLAAKTLAMFAAGVCVYGAVVLSQWVRDVRVACNLTRNQYLRDDQGLKEKLLPQSSHEGFVAAGVVTFRDLVDEFQISIGKRPDIAIHLRELHGRHRSRCSNKLPIGVFLSGPASLKTATASAVASIGVSEFDIHEEEFEL